MQPPAEAVLQRHAEVGAPAALRLEIRLVDAVRGEPRVRVGLEEVELVLERELDLARELAPVAREGLRALENLAEAGRGHVAAEVDAVEAQAARDGDMLGRELDEEGPAVVGDLLRGAPRARAARR